jgi:2-C-methyl-D-erythritol 4-phosphate cytidylyltransferase
VKVGAIIVAAGESERMGGVDKMLASLEGKPVLAHAVEAVVACEAVERAVVVVREDAVAGVREMTAEHGWDKVSKVCAGGRRRQDSVQAGLDALGPCEWIVIHDGARPLVTPGLIERGLTAADETGAAIAAMRVTDTIKVTGMDRIVRYTPERGSLWAVQTPQVFRADIIAGAYDRARDGDVTDDSTLVEQSGHRVKLYPGAYDNIKITVPDDLLVAETLWRRRQA